MSEVTHKIHKEVVEVKHRICDGCSRVIEQSEDHYNFIAMHYEWGNDSRESLESYDVCSYRCYIKCLSKSYDEFKDYPSAEIDEKDLWLIRGILEENNINDR